MSAVSATVSNIIESVVCVRLLLQQQKQHENSLLKKLRMRDGDGDGAGGWGVCGAWSGVMVCD